MADQLLDPSIASRKYDHVGDPLEDPEHPLRSPYGFLPHKRLMERIESILDAEGEIKGHAIVMASLQAAERRAHDVAEVYFRDDGGSVVHEHSVAVKAYDSLCTLVQAVLN